MSENVFLTDVLDQPRAIRSAMERYRDDEALLERVAKQKPRRVLFTGMGSSHYCSQPSVIRLNQAGIDARMESAGEILHYERGAIAEDTWLVLTSQSGESGEIVDLIKKLPHSQMVVGITNNANSALGRRANLLLEMRVADELAVSTRTYLASLVLSDMLTSAMLGEKPDFNGVLGALDALDALLQGHQQIGQQMESLLGLPDNLSCIGRGPARATAECGALFIRETAKYPALAFDAGEFRHGPFEMVDDAFAAILFAPDGPARDMQLGLCKSISACGGCAVLVTDAPVEIEDRRIITIRHEPVPERLAPLVQIAVPQLFANYAALRRGFAPGIFRQSSKITTAQ